MKKNIDKVRANIFPDARPYIQEWEKFPWHTDRRGHCDTDKKNSSQALAIDVFGTLAINRAINELMNTLIGKWDLQSSGDWEIQLEYLDTENLVREKRRSQIDAAAWSDNCLVFFECKFTEQGGGACSQINKLSRGANKGKVQCNGNYELQTNPANNQQFHCALTGKGIRYWEYIPEIFDLDANQDYAPCPFAGSEYQWMRNLVVCQAKARKSKRQAVFVLVYADNPGLPMAKKVHTSQWDQFAQTVQSREIQIRAISYQQLIRHAKQMDGPEAALWNRLEQWVQHKIDQVIPAR